MASATVVLCGLLAVLTIVAAPGVGAIGGGAALPSHTAPALATPVGPEPQRSASAASPPGPRVVSVPVGSNPIGVAFDPQDHHVFVTDEFSNNVTVFSAITGAAIASIPVGAGPNGVVYDPTTHDILALNFAPGSIDVIAPGTDRVTRTISLGGVNPLGLAYDPATKQVFVADGSNGTVSVVSVSSGKTVATVPVGLYPEAIAYDSVTHDVYVANYDSDSVSVISGSTDQVLTTIPVGSSPAAVLDTPDLSQVVVANSGSSNLSVISVTNNEVVASITTGDGPSGLVLDTGIVPHEVVSLNSGSNNVSVISDTTHQTLLSVPIGDNPQAGAYDAADRLLFVANWGSDNVSELSGAPYELRSAAFVGSPEALVYSGSGDSVYLQDGTKNDVREISGATLGVTHTISGVGTAPGPESEAYDASTQQVFALGNATTPDAITILSTMGHDVAGTISLGGMAPAAILYDPTDHDLYVVGEGAMGPELSVVSDQNDTDFMTMLLGLPDPTTLAYDPADQELFVGSGDHSIITAYLVTPYAVLGGDLIPTPFGSNGVDGMVYDPAAHELFAWGTNSTMGTPNAQVVVASATTLRVVTTITVGSPGTLAVPSAVAYDSARDQIVVSAESASDVYELVFLSVHNNSVVGSYPLAGAALGMAFDPVTDDLFVTVDANGDFLVLSDGWPI